MQEERTRLHISPLNPELLPVVLTQTLLNQATNISFHTIETFPEKNYGYLDLPTEEAEKLRKKLNGCMLRGQKMKVEGAKPNKSRKKESTENDGSATGHKKSLSKKKKRREEEDGVIPAVELPKERKVKRGWTEGMPQSVDGKSKKGRQEGKEKKKKLQAKDASITGETECLFKTKLPPNVQAKGGKSKKRKRGDEGKEIVVHEFRNTAKHAGFLRDDTGSNDRKMVKEFVEGKGWVDEDGNVVEKEPKRRRNDREKINLDNEDVNRKGKAKRQTKVESAVGKAVKVEREPEETDETSSSGISDSEDEDSLEDESAAQAEEVGKIPGPQGHADRQGLGISSIDNGELRTAQVERLSINRSSASSSSSPAPHVQDQSTPEPEPLPEVHPLEALFKRPQAAASQTQTPQKPHLELSTSFSFFNTDPKNAGGGENSSILIPQTPFTQQDIRLRRQRSAAPTPDTAAPAKTTFGNVWGGDMDDIESDEEEEDKEGEEEAAAAADSPSPPGVDGKRKGKAKKQEEKDGGKQEESEFAKWFWEHRGENNRAWKRRKRDVAKEKKTRDKRLKR
ncbi:MAG: hypothetical protein Q9163_004575 [Psora crenata]